MKYDEHFLPFERLELPHPEAAFDQQTDSKLLDWIETITMDWPDAARDLGNTLTDNPGRISSAYLSLLAGYSMLRSAMRYIHHLES